jgi:hypothetical protein
MLLAAAGGLVLHMALYTGRGSYNGFLSEPVPARKMLW